MPLCRNGAKVYAPGVFCFTKDHISNTAATTNLIYTWGLSRVGCAMTAVDECTRGLCLQERTHILGNIPSLPSALDRAMTARWALEFVQYFPEKTFPTVAWKIKAWMRDNIKMDLKFKWQALMNMIMNIRDA